MQHTKTALVLGSGGVRGLSYLGVLDVLHELDIEFDIIVGSSIGAWIGAHYALHQDMEMLYNTTLGYRKDKLKSLFEPTLHGGIVKGNKMGELLGGWLGGETRIEDLKTKVAVVSTDIRSGESVIHTSGLLVPAVQASMAIPTLFAPVSFDDQLLVDGGLSNPVPVDVAQRLGAERIIAVQIDGASPATQDITREDLTIKAVINRSLDILQYHVAKPVTTGADVLITPSIKDTGFMSWRKYFAQKQGDEYVEAGKKAAQDALPEIKRLFALD